MSSGAPTPSDRLLRVTPDQYGTDYRAHLLEQYKLYVESAQKISDQRQTASNFLLTVCSSLVTLYGLAYSAQALQRWHALVPAAGLLVALVWHSLVVSYRKLNSAKFAVIQRIEQHLPLAPYRAEWELCERGVGQAYRPVTHIERWIPIVFAVLFVALGVATLVAPLSKKEEPKPVSVTGSMEVTVKPSTK